MNQRETLKTNEQGILEIGGVDVKSLKEKESYEKAGRLNALESFDNQINLVESYLPKQLNEDEIKNIISNLDNKDIPNIMKYFKTNYNGEVDMKLVNQLAREVTK